MVFEENVIVGKIPEGIWKNVLFWLKTWYLGYLLV